MERSGKLIMGAVCGAALLILTSGLAPAAPETNALASPAPATFKFGGDERIREEYFNYIPINAKEYYYEFWATPSREIWFQWLSGHEKFPLFP